MVWRKEPRVEIYWLAPPILSLHSLRPLGKSHLLLDSLGNKSSAGMFSKLVGTEPTSHHRGPAGSS